MKEEHRGCIEEVKELMIQISETIKKYGFEDEVVVALAVGFLNMDDISTLPNEEGSTVSMNLLSSISVEDEDELEDLLSYMVEAYQIEQEDNPSNINYWINRMNPGDLN